jgi:hypothetical protein
MKALQLQSSSASLNREPTFVLIRRLLLAFCNEKHIKT